LNRICDAIHALCKQNYAICKQIQYLFFTRNDHVPLQFGASLLSYTKYYEFIEDPLFLGVWVLILTAVV